MPGKPAREAPPGRLMDAATIARELGVKRATVDAIILWCSARRFVRPAGVRKLYVYRADVEAWLEANTKSTRRGGSA